MFLNISVSVFSRIWLSPFPTKNRGEQKPPLRAPETLAVSIVPPFPRFFLETHMSNGAISPR